MRDIQSVGGSGSMIRVRRLSMRYTTGESYVDALVDVSVTFADWPAIKSQMPYRALSVLEIDGKLLAQSNGINRYVAELAGLYPGDHCQQRSVTRSWMPLRTALSWSWQRFRSRATRRKRLPDRSWSTDRYARLWSNCRRALSKAAENTLPTIGSRLRI